MLLVFAGLVSAVLTAFDVESYGLLQQEDGDEILDTLKTIRQLNSFAYTAPFANATIQSSDAPWGMPFAAPAYAIWLNTLWFSALICTLSASSIAIMVRQWLHHYSTGVSGNSRDAARLRQYRYQAQLVKWHVAEIVSLLPVLLQLSLVLFLSGLLILVWLIHPIVAIISTAFTGFLVVFTVWTTIAPAFQSDCCYQSPQALYFLLFVQYLGGTLRLMVQGVGQAARDIAIWRPSGVIRTTFWAVWEYCNITLTSLGAWGVLRTLEMREKRTLRFMSADVDFCLVHASYELTLDDGLMKGVFTRCLDDIDSMAVLRGCLHKHTTVEDLFFVYDIDRDSFVELRYPLGQRQVRYHTHLFTRVLSLLPKCLDNVGPFGYDRAEMEDLAHKILALLPPKIEGAEKCLRPSEAFLKITTAIRVLDSSYDGARLRDIKLDTIRQVIDTFPQDADQVGKVLEWKSHFFLSDFVAAATAIMHYLMDARSSSEAEASTDESITQNMARTLHSLEVVISQPVWKEHDYAREATLSVLCGSSLTTQQGANHPPFLATLSQLSRNEETATLITPQMVQAIRDARSVLMPSMPSVPDASG
ncbi:hypothetical protein C8Q80DRAFT_1266547 [Daedaleopsis nitida]|nr:hypothetical protein C8Q80DRAFT_1266547 [Daedaleopsis nitida]